MIHRLPRGESLLLPRLALPGLPGADRALGQRAGARVAVAARSLSALRRAHRAALSAGGARSPRCVFAAIALRYGASAMTLVWFAFAAALIAAAAIDFDHRIIPDEISVGGPARRARGGSGRAVDRRQRALRRPRSDARCSAPLLGAGALWSVGFAHARIATALGRRFEHWPEPGAALPAAELSSTTGSGFPASASATSSCSRMIGAVVGPLGALETILAASLVGPRARHRLGGRHAAVERALRLRARAGRRSAARGAEPGAPDSGRLSVAAVRTASRRERWFPGMDSNHHKQVQSLLSCR